MRFCLLFLFFLSYPLFAQDSTGNIISPQGNKAQEVPLNGLTASFLLQQLQEKTVLLEDSIVEFSRFISGVMRANHGVGEWTEPFSPGEIFNRCGSLIMSIRCYWSLLRLDRLMGKGKNQNTQIISGWNSTENFKEEIRRVIIFRGDKVDGVVWLLLSSIEFYDWAIEKDVSDPERLFPLTDDLAKRFLDDHYAIFNLSGSPLLLYALHHYFLRRGFEEERIQIEGYIKKLYLHRNDGSEMDLQGAALLCDMEKRAGIHKDYLTKNGLIFPDYEEFEERTASEDIQRIQVCEKRHQTATRIDQYEKEKASHIVERETIIQHYSLILLVLYKVFGKEAVRNFVRYNPPLYKTEVVPFLSKAVLIWLNIHWTHIQMAIILRDVYEDDIEWQVEWQSVIDDHKEELSKNLLTVYSNEIVVVLAHIMQFTKLSLLEQE